MKLVFAGTPEVAVPALDALLASGRHEVAAVVTRPDAPAGRGRRLVASPVAERAAEAGVEALASASPRDGEFLDRLRAIAPDCCPVVAYGALLPKAALDVPARGWVNLHFSLLPAWRGAAPVQHALMAGDEVTGASTFLIEEARLGPRLRRRHRGGPPLRHQRRPAHPARPRGRRAARGDDGRHRGRHPPGGAAARGGRHPRPEDHRRGRPCGLGRAGAPRGPRGAGLHARPGAWTLFRGERLKIVQAAPAPDRTDLAPGELAAGRNTVHVGTGSHAVELVWVQAQGKKPMRAADWARGVRIAPGERLGA